MGLDPSEPEPCAGCQVLPGAFAWATEYCQSAAECSRALPSATKRCQEEGGR